MILVCFISAVTGSSVTNGTQWLFAHTLWKETVHTLMCLKTHRASGNTLQTAAVYHLIFMEVKVLLDCWFHQGGSLSCPLVPVRICFSLVCSSLCNHLIILLPPSFPPPLFLLAFFLFIFSPTPLLPLSPSLPSFFFPSLLAFCSSPFSFFPLLSLSSFPALFSSSAPFFPRSPSVLLCISLVHKIGVQCKHIL